MGVPGSNCAEQIVPQEIPVGELSTVPPAKFVRTTVRVTLAGTDGAGEAFRRHSFFDFPLDFLPDLLHFFLDATACGIPRALAEKASPAAGKSSAIANSAITAVRTFFPRLRPFMASLCVSATRLKHLRTSQTPVFSRHTPSDEFRAE